MIYKYKDDLWTYEKMNVTYDNFYIKMDDKRMNFYETLVHEYNFVIHNFGPRNLEHWSYQG